MTADAYAYWRAVLRGEQPPIHETDPQIGFYRQRSKNKVALPVAIWRDDAGTLLAMVGDRMVDPVECWTWCCRDAITHEVYEAVRGGAPWPDLAPSLAKVEETKRAEKAKAANTFPARGVGDNSGAIDPAEEIRDQIEAAKADLPTYQTITSEEQQAAAQSLRSRLNELSREADKKREVEKRPHFEAAKAVDAKWQPLVKGAKDAADQIAKAMSAYETEKLRRAREEQRKREEEAARQAEEARKAAEAARESEEPNRGPEFSTVYVPEPERDVFGLPPVPADPAPMAEPTTIKGAYGRGAAVKVKRIARVVDQDAVYQYMRQRPEVIDLLQTLAQRAFDAGRDVPGITIDEEARVA